jgi:transposase, IS6 family
VEELMRKRGMVVDHTTVFRWLQYDAPELDKRCRPYLRATDGSYRVHEAYMKIKKHWYDLYRAVDFTGATLHFVLSATREPTQPSGFSARYWRHTIQRPHV